MRRFRGKRAGRRRVVQSPAVDSTRGSALPGGPAGDLERARRLGHRVDRLAAGPVGERTQGSVVQSARDPWSSQLGGLIPDLVIDTDTPGIIKLSSPSNEKVQGSLEYHHVDANTTRLKTVQAFPQGYGLGTLLLHYLGHIARQRGSKIIDIAMPALTETGFYRHLGASFTETGATRQTQNALLADQEVRETAWSTLLDDAARKSWNSGGYFEGKTQMRFDQLPDEQRESVKEAKAYELKESKKGMIDAYLENRGALITSPTGLRFEDIPKLIERSGTSLGKRWKPVG